MSKNVWLWNHYAIQMCEEQDGRHFWFAENLIKQGYSASVFCANTYHTKDECIDTGKNKHIVKKGRNTPFVFVKTKPSIGNGIARIKNMYYFYKNLFSVSKSYAKQTNVPDVIVASSVHPLTMIAGIKIAKKFNIPCVCEIRDLWPEAIFAFGKARENSLLGKILVAGEYWIYKNADALIFTKEGDTDYIIEKKWDTANGGKIDLKKCHYINNGIDISSFMESIKNNKLDDPDLTDNKFNVTYTGTIRPVNNVGGILDTASLLKAHSDIQFLIYGTGNQLEFVKQRVRDEKLTNVIVKGQIQRKYIPYVLSKSSINLLNYSQTQYNWSRGNSSNKLFEYMASGKPIISTVKTGYSIIAKYNCGVEIENSKPQDLAKAILNIKNLSNIEYEQMGQNAMDGAKGFDYKVLTEKLIKVLISVM
jgi:glycosyltransferase involved in cell wall biosynthesis